MSRPEPIPTQNQPLQRQFRCLSLGTIDYPSALKLQRQMRSERQAGLIADTLLLLEHPPTYTRGRRADAAELPLGLDFYRRQDIAIFDTERGGRVTYHGPGQLVGYTIMAVSDVIAHLRKIEQALIDLLAQLDIEAHSREQEGADYTGVWVEDRKIASIGIHVSRGVSTHGFALNVSNDLQPFAWIVPCGLDGVSMTSVRAELPPAADADAESLNERLRELAARHFGERFAGAAPHRPLSAVGA